MITYRKADKNDVSDLVDIRCEFLTEANGGELDESTLSEVKTTCTDYFARAINDGSFVAWLAEDKSEIIATSGICFYTIPPNKSCPNGKVGYIQNMYTKKDHRRQGIAKLLFSKMVEEAKIHSCRKILLNATDMGKPLYKQFGFHDVEGDMAYYL